MNRFPTRVEDISPSLMTGVLAEGHPEVQVDSIEIIGSALCGDGFASTADRVALRLNYAPGKDAGLPARMLLKTMLASPHAPRAMYANEVRFYREIRPTLEIEAPRTYGSLFDPESGQFGILMEDLTGRSARFPNATTFVSVEEVQDLLRTLASLHSTFWTSLRFASDLDWLPTPRRGGMFEIFDKIGLELVRDQVDNHQFKAELIARLGRSIDQLWSDLWKVQAILDSEPTTLLHGDPHCGNTYLLPDGGGFLDWQLMARGRWAHDVTYLMITTLDTEDRRSHERELLELYIDELGRGGVAAPPTFDDAWQLYRCTVVWGLVIGWLICPPTNYGEEITCANLRRIVTAAEDLETFAAID